MLITGVYDGSRHGGAQLDGAPRFLRSSIRAGRLRVRIPPPCLVGLEGSNLHISAFGRSKYIHLIGLNAGDTLSGHRQRARR